MPTPPSDRKDLPLTLPLPLNPSDLCTVLIRVICNRHHAATIAGAAADAAAEVEGVVMAYAAPSPARPASLPLSSQDVRALNAWGLFDPLVNEDSL